MPVKRFAIALSAGTFLVVLSGATAASAQTVFDPTASPELNTGGWINNIGQAMLIFGAIAVVAIVFGYMRFSSKFRGTAEDPPTVLAPRVAVGAVAARPAAPAPVPAAVPAPVPAAAAPAAPVAAAVAASAAPPAAVSAAAPAVPAPATPAAPAAPATPAPAPASEKPAHVEPDQETFDRVLKEQLDKGVDRRVAEGRAKSAGIVAARKKAGG
jgi:hypothetical protein